MGRKSFVAALNESLIPIIAPVADNPRTLKTGQLCRILNSTPLGEVLTDRRLRGHRERAGSRISDGKTIDLVRYAAWLASQRDRTPRTNVSPETPRGDATYDAKKERERKRNASSSRSGRDVGPIPAVVDPERKARARDSLLSFLEAYFSEKRFVLAWSDDHLRMIKRLETATREGGYFALAMPRASGKSAITEAAVLWATLFGYRRFVVFVGASKEAADESLASIKSELDSNDLLLEDFPEACHPIRCLEGINNRASGQHCHGAPTQIGWKGKRIVLPTIAGSAASGAILTVTSITGRIRGMKFVRPDGANVRPELVVIDDPQTDTSARSDYQCDTRLKTIATSIMGLPAPGTRISIVVPCTVIRKGDVASTLLDREKFPEFHGEVCPMIRSFPKNMELWEKYREVRDADYRGGGNGTKATQFYAKHRKAMDEAAVVYWPERFEPWQASGVQYAMDLFLQTDPQKLGAFYSEYQNDPLDDSLSATASLEASAIAAKISGLAAGTAPHYANLVTAYIDVQHSLLYWVVAAWGNGFQGSVIQYGTWPEQSKNYFTVRNSEKTFETLYPGLPLAAQVHKALSDFVPQLLDHPWLREDEVPLKLARAMIDVADGHTGGPTCDWIRSSKYSGILIPATGRGIGPTNKPFSEYHRQPGELHGEHLIVSKMGKRNQMQVRYDTNYWKSLVAQFILAPVGQDGCITLYGDARANHRMFADHCIAERAHRVTAEQTGRTVDMWKLKPGLSENHFWDGLVGTAVAASMQGISLIRNPTTVKKKGKAKRESVSYFQL